MEDNHGTALPSTFDDGEMYDLLLGEIPYGVDFYVGLAREAAGPVLDVACGTGRIFLPCLAAGVDIEGLDLYEPMLQRLRANAAKRGLSTRLHQGDMSAFQLSRCFSLIMIPFNAFIHNMTQEAQVDCLRRCREHLLPNGQLVFDTFFPALSIVGAPDGIREMELEMVHPVTGQRVRLYDTRTFDRVAQTQHSVNEIEFLDADDRVTRIVRSQIASRYVYKHEMELLLRVAGFSRWAIYGGFDRRPLTVETDAMIVSAWNDGGTRRS